MLQTNMAPTTTMLKSGALLAMSAVLVLSMLAGEVQAFFCPLGCSSVNCGPGRRCKDEDFMSCECVDWKTPRGRPAAIP
jgi:hypothetical protein